MNSNVPYHVLPQKKCCVGCDGNPSCLGVTTCPHTGFYNCGQPNCGWLTCNSTTVCCNGGAANPACVARGAATCVKPIPRCNVNHPCGVNKYCCPTTGCLNSQCEPDGGECPNACWKTQKCGSHICGPAQKCCNKAYTSAYCTVLSAGCGSATCNATRGCANGYKCCPGGPTCSNNHCILSTTACSAACIGV